MTTASPQTGNPWRRIWPLVIGVILFGSLMAVRYELASAWARAAVTSVAAVVLLVAVVVSRRA